MQITKLPQSASELAESLEQLRWLANGYRIKCAIIPGDTISVDTQEDLKNAIQFLRSGR
jgi:3-deoxy-manno-octulosonate cytidylyltransferase (CMP-KDO synthetase)